MPQQQDLFGNTERAEPASAQPQSEAPQARIRALTAEIERHNDLYYNQAEPEIKDREYDLLMSELAELERLHPDLASPHSPTQHVGGAPAEGFDTIQHPVPMLSISNTYSPSDVLEFDARVRRLLGTNEEVEYLVELKIDGVSATLMYRDGRLDGVWREFHANGQLRHETPCRNGWCHGQQRLFAEDGTLLHVELWTDGTGTWREYDAEGTLQHEAHYRDGWLHGPCREYDEAGGERRCWYYVGGWRRTREEWQASAGREGAG